MSEKAFEANVIGAGTTMDAVRVNTAGLTKPYRLEIHDIVGGKARFVVGSATGEEPTTKTWSGELSEASGKWSIPEEKLKKEA